MLFHFSSHRLLPQQHANGYQHEPEQSREPEANPAPTAIVRVVVVHGSLICVMAFTFTVTANNLTRASTFSMSLFKTLYR